MERQSDGVDDYGQPSGPSVLEPAALAEAFDAHYQRIWGFLYQRGGRSCADDLAGEVFVVALARRGRFDPQRGELHSWLFGIAANLAREWLRRQARRRRALDRLAGRTRTDIDPSLDDAMARVDDRLSGHADVARVLVALRALPDRDQEILVLAVWQGLSYEEMATALGVAVGTIRSRLSRARGRLRELVDLDGQVPDTTTSRERP